MSAASLSDTTASTLRFSWTCLLSQVCSLLQRASSAQQLSADECGAVGSFIADEVQLHAIELTTVHVGDFQQHMDALVEHVISDTASDAAVDRNVRFLRGDNTTHRCQSVPFAHLDLCSSVLLLLATICAALGSSAYTVPLILSAAVKALLKFMEQVQLATSPQPSSAHHAAASTANSASALSFSLAHLKPILRCYHLCHLLDSFVLLPTPPALLLPTVADCVERLHGVYEASLQARVYDAVPLVCAYVWRIRSVVDGVSAAEEADTAFEYVRREKTKQREADVKAENDTLL